MEMEQKVKRTEQIKGVYCSKITDDDHVFGLIFRTLESIMPM